MKTLIIIPTYNELENLHSLLKEIFSYAPATDILIVDDNSPDGTGELADQMSIEHPRIHVLHRAGKLGLGTAYIAGFKCPRCRAQSSLKSPLCPACSLQRVALITEPDADSGSCDISGAWLAGNSAGRTDTCRTKVRGQLQNRCIPEIWLKYYKKRG